MKPWWVTIRLDPTRTRDELIQARSQWSAGWLYHQLHPDAEITCVRPVLRTVLRTEQPEP